MNEHAESHGLVLVAGTTCDYIDWIRRSRPRKSLFITRRSMRNDADFEVPPPDEELLIDSDDKDVVYSALVTHLEKYGQHICGVAGYDCESLFLVSFLAEKLGLPYPPAQAILNCRQKLLAITLWQAANVTTPRAVVVKSADDAVSFFNESKNGAIVLKPLTGSGSEHTYKCASVAEVRTSFSAAKSALLRRAAEPIFTSRDGGSTDTLAVDFVSGIEYSCDFYVPRKDAIQHDVIQHSSTSGVIHGADDALKDNTTSVIQHDDIQHSNTTSVIQHDDVHKNIIQNNSTTTLNGNNNELPPVRITRLCRKYPLPQGPFGTTGAYEPLYEEDWPVPSAELSLFLSRAADAVGLSGVVCMADIIVHNNAPHLLEMAARPAGDCLLWAMTYMRGLDSVSLVHDLAAGITATLSDAERDIKKGARYENKDSAPKQSTTAKCCEHNGAQQRAIALRIFAEKSGTIESVDTSALLNDSRVCANSLHLSISTGHTVIMPPTDYDSRILGHVVYIPNDTDSIEDQNKMLREKISIIWKQNQ